MPYLFTHLCVRNDDHCPICRRHYISVHESLDEAYDAALQKLSNDELPEDIENLKNGDPIWIDEWVRRSNGDHYQITKIEEGEIYNLQDLYIQHDLCANEDDEKDSNTANFMLLHINIRKEEWCPDNITVNISFYSSLDSASERVNSLLTNDKLQELLELEPVWTIQGGRDGDHYQIIKIENSESMYLNELYPQIHPDAW